MGDCKSQMTPKSDKAKTIFGMIKAKRKQSTPEDAASTVADKLADLDDTLSKLVTVKQTEFNTEKGREAYNQKALAHLQTMQFHLDQIIEIAEAYTKLN